MKQTETTNILLLLILIVLLAGFGFLAPILWVLGGVLGLWLLIKILGAVISEIGKIVDTVENYVGRIFSSVWKLVSAIFGNDIVQWCLLLVSICFVAWFYFITGKDGYLAAIVFLGLFALFKVISRWDTVMISRKYRRNDKKDA